MPFIPATNVAQVAMRYNQNGESCENVYHVLNSSAWDVTTLTALANVFKTWESGTAAALRGNVGYLYDIYVRDLTTQSSPEIDLAISPTIPGLINAQLAPNSVTIAIKAQTGLAGRSTRGRTYWIGLTESQYDANWMNTTPLASIVSALNTLTSAVNAVSGHQLCVLSLRHNNAWRSSGLATPITTWVSVDNVVDVQRRRLPAHNRHH